MELLRNEVVLMGNSAAWGGELVVADAVVEDAIALAAVQAALRGTGLNSAGGQLAKAEREGRLVAGAGEGRALLHRAHPRAAAHHVG